MLSTVSAVISTYNSPEKLRAALRSVELQSQAVDEIIVVGDCCSDETERMLEELSLPNLRYVNLPVRCGEQSIPNAIGTLMASSRFVAYLNHDDLWLPWHISLAMESLSRNGKSWFIGSAAFCDSEAEEAGQVVPQFGSRTDPERTVAKSFTKVFNYLEPSSSWVVERDWVVSAKNWTPAWKIGRTPLAELPLRLWKEKGEPNFGKDLSVAKVMGNRRKSSEPYYGHLPSLHRYLENLLRETGERWPEEISWPTWVSKGRNWYSTVLFAHLPGGDWSRKLLNRAVLAVYQIIGIDLVDRAIRKQSGTGQLLEEALKIRTGEEHLNRIDVSEVAAQLGLTGSRDDQGSEGS